jgi:hypothetical protein
MRAIQRYACLHANGMYCTRCLRRLDLFGLKYRETGWESWCRACNVEWMTHSMISSYRCCSRAHARLSDNLAKYIASYEWVKAALLHRLPMRKHKRSLQLLEWFCVPLNGSLWLWASEEDPMIWTLEEPHVRNSAFKDNCFDPLEEEDPTLLRAIHSYLSPSLQDALFE